MDGVRITSPDINIIVDLKVGIASPKKEYSDFLIYPCPFTDKITLAGLPEENKEVRIYSAGSILSHCQIYSGQQFDINLSDLNAGLYFLMVISSQATFKKKIIKIE
jgi:hypothetical protein